MPRRIRAWFRFPSFCAFCAFAVIALLVAAGKAAPAPAGPAAAPAESLPTQDEIHQLFDQKQYAQVLRQVARVLALKGNAAVGYDRHDLVRLKAETHLRLKAYPAAEQEFVAAAAETRDEKAAALDLATAVLVHRSRNGRYEPVEKVNGKGAAAVSVVEPDLRDVALSALFRDELAAEKQRVTALRDTESLDALAELAPMVTRLRILEMAATGGRSDQGRQLVLPLARHAEDLMNDVEQDMVKRLNIIVDRANRQYMMSVAAADAAQSPLRPAFDLPDKRQIAKARADCEKIAPAARALGEAIGPEGARLIALGQAAERIGAQTAEMSR